MKQESRDGRVWGIASAEDVRRYLRNVSLDTALRSSTGGQSLSQAEKDGEKRRRKRFVFNGENISEKSTLHKQRAPVDKLLNLP